MESFREDGTVMENEKFQELVLEHLAKLTQDITELKIGQQNLEKGQKELQTGQEELRNNQKEFQAGLEDLRNNQKEMQIKLDLVYNHTAKLTENLTNFQAETNQKLDLLSDDMKYLKYKEAQNEEDLFKVKAYLKMTK